MIRPVFSKFTLNAMMTMYWGKSGMKVIGEKILTVSQATGDDNLVVIIKVVRIPFLIQSINALRFLGRGGESYFSEE